MIKRSLNCSNYLVSALFLIIGFCIIILTRNYPIGDFGNYYYGSKLFVEGKFSVLDYQSISYFNQQISSYGELNFFENYTPVPPFSLLFYVPFTFLTCLKAKLFFNIISLFIFCFSLLRLLQNLTINNWKAYLLPFIFLYPLYNNIYQGQTYLLIAAFLIEAYIASEKHKHWLTVFYLSICICLKLFPVFILFYFIIDKKYRVVIYTLLLTLTLFVLTSIMVGNDIFIYYFKVVLPRLWNNDIIGTYYHGNQSIYSFLLNLFSFDSIHNKTPIVQLSWLVPIIEGILVAFFISVLIASRKKNPTLFFGITLFCSLLIGRYNTTYSMLILIPFIVAIIANEQTLTSNYIILICMGIAISMPIGHFLNASIIIKFSRLIFLLCTFIVMVVLYKLTIDVRVFLVIGIPILLFKYFTFAIKPIQYFGIQNAKGILYDYELKKDSVILFSTLGKTIYKQSFALQGIVRIDEALAIKDGIVYYQGQSICNTKDNKSKPFIYNDSSAVFMSDLNQAIGFYKLRFVNLHP